MQLIVGLERIDQEALKDEKLKKIIQDLIRDPYLHEGYSIRNRSLLYKKMIIVSRELVCIP